MIPLLAALGAIGYAVTVLYAARTIYGRLRAHAIDHDDRPYGSTAVQWFNETDRPFVMFFSLILATIWPAALALALAVRTLYRFLDNTPVRSRIELEAEAKTMTARVSELERDLGIEP